MQLSCFPKRPICRHESREHWHDHFNGITNRLAALARENFGIGDEIAMDCRGQFYCDPYWLLIIQRRNLELCHVSFLSPVWFQNEVTINDHAYRKARTDGQCRLDVQIAPDDLLAGLI